MAFLYAIFTLAATVALMAGAAVAQEPASRYLPRANYGARFEPEAGIVHGAGQTWGSEPQNSAFDRYSAMMAQQGTLPLTFMDYAGPGTPLSFYGALRARLDAYEKDGHATIPQIGFYLPAGSAALTEAQLATLSGGLKALNRPVYLRVGYEMNGAWYEPRYEPDVYIREFRRVVTRLRRDSVPFAALWNMCPGWDSGGGAGGTCGTWEFMSRFYPGDDYVDWFSMDLFSVTDITNPHTADFLAQAHAHGKPVMIGETTPRHVGAAEAACWDAWFEPFFELIRANPGIKGHTYINWDWGPTRWPDWGDARLEAPHGDPSVRAAYLAELADPVYCHGGPALPVLHDRSGERP